VKSDRNIEYIDPEKRNCYFDDEHPPNQPLTAHKKYSQVSCLLECRIKHVLSLFSDSDKCLPWYFPPVDSGVRLCSPYESRNFSREMEKMPHDVCKGCLPNCDETFYTSSVSAAPFRHCDFKNLGMTPLCDLGQDNEDDTGFASISPPIWGENVIEQYMVTSNAVPAYVSNSVKSNRRIYTSNDRQRNSAVFTATNKLDDTYDAYERDIAIVSFYFEYPTAFEYIREARMTAIGYISQMGGLLGLCFGFSFLSGLEIIYWCTYRLFRNARDLNEDK